jgi:ATP-dependent DNA helicase RecQ
MKTPQSILKQIFGYDQFRFDQKKIIESVLAKKDILAVMPTGGGKSLCYQIPAMCNDGMTLVISPLISLMNDQITQLKQFGVSCAALHSNLDLEDQKEIYKDLYHKKIKILYMSPEGVLNNRNIELLAAQNISLIAIDEAHCISNWGHEFRSDYAKLGGLKRDFPNASILALTATADDRTREDIVKQLKMETPKIYISSFNRPNIEYHISERIDEYEQLKNFIEKFHPNQTGIVYCLSRKKVEKTAETLKKLGFNAIAYHAGLPKKLKDKNQTRFNNEDPIIVVATIAFGMGINRPDVRFVAHLDLPKNIEAYSQETGRAGRDGLPATAWLLYGLQDAVKLSSMLESTQASPEYKAYARFKTDMMVGLCETLDCRRHFLLKYFEEQSPNTCAKCDNCLMPPEQEKVTIDAQKALSTIYKTGQFYGSSYVIDILKGAQTAKVKENNHELLSVYGIGKEKSKTHWNRVLRKLLHLNAIQINNWQYRSLGLTNKASPILKKEQDIFLRKNIYENQTFPTTSKDSKKPKDLNFNDESFLALKQLRMTIALKDAVPPYVVFSDRSLQEMCAKRPKNQSDFLLIHGVGQKKLEKYGDIFLAALNDL